MDADGQRITVTDFVVLYRVFHQHLHGHWRYLALQEFHDNHYVGIFYGHRVGGHFCRTDFGHDVLDFGEAFLQPFLGCEREFDAPAQRASCGQGHLHGEVAFVEGRDELRSQFREEQQRGQGHEELLSDGEMYDFCKHIGFSIKFSVGQN